MGTGDVSTDVLVAKSFVPLVCMASLPALGGGSWQWHQAVKSSQVQWNASAAAVCLLP